MDNIRCQKIRDKDDDKQGEVKLKREGKEGLLSIQENSVRAMDFALAAETKSVGRQLYSCSAQQARLQLQEPTSPSPPQPPPCPSASSSPSHEFSFTISVHHPPSSATTAAAAATDKTKTNPAPSFSAIDLSPADEIFFHGHLLPLHLLSHLPVSPRSSTNSMDSFTLPIKELSQDQQENKTSNNITNEDNKDLDQNSHDHHKGRAKPKSFSLFGLPKWRKGCEVQEKEPERQKRKMKFDVSQVLKRYIRMVRPLLSFRSRRESMNFQRQSHSFSGNLSFRGKKKELIRGRRGEYSSAPASMWTSPTNSGHLVATGSIHTSTSDSTMEELQAAIQAAIAHCKNSIATEDKKQP